MFQKNQKMVNGHGFFRKKKACGLVCGIVLGLALVFSGSQVSADEVITPQTQPATEFVELKTNQLDIPKEETTVPTMEKLEVTSDVPTTVPSTITQDQAVKAVDEAQNTLKADVTTAKDAGVVVAEGETKEVVINSGNAVEKTNEVLTDLNQQDKSVKEATEKQLENVKAYEETKVEHEAVLKEGQDSLMISTDEVDKLMEEAKQAGLLVTETMIEHAPDYKSMKGLTGDELRQAMYENLNLYKKAVEAGLTLQNKSVADLRQALALYQANQKAYYQANTTYKDGKSAGVADLELADGRQNQVVDLAKKNGVPIDTKRETVNPDYVNIKGLTGDDLRKAVEKNITLYKQAVADSVAKQDKSTNEAKATLDVYLKALADYKAGIGTQSGIKWGSNTTVEAGTAQRMTGDEPAVSWGNLRTAAADAIQSLDRNQNTDAKFDNLFKINGTGTVIIKNTTNGDVTLKISNIVAWKADNTYLAVWGAKDGGIAWGVFASQNNGTVTGGAGEGATGGNVGASGAVLAMVKSYDYEVSTSNAVSTVTFNDIDNNQTLTLNGLDGSKLVKGRNINQSGNSYFAGAGDVSQSSGGVIDSNGVQFNFDTARKVIFSGTHFLPGYINTSIVAGIFGVASEVPKEPIKPSLEVKNVEVVVPVAPEAPKPLSVAVQKATVTVPEAPEVPDPVKVSVSYYKMTTTPEEVALMSDTPAVVLPQTGVKSSSLGILGFVIVGLLGLVSFKKKEEM